MTGRRRGDRLVRLYPLLGAIAIAVLVGFVYVSYTANGGLPLTSSYVLNAELPNANRLIRTDEVRIAGVRVGQVTSVQARLAPDGTPYSVIGLALSPGDGPLPVDTHVEVQSSSVLGQTYVDLTPGTSADRVRSGGTLPLSDARPTVQLTDLLDIFDHSTARAIQHTITGFGYGFAGRGPALNAAIAGLAHLLGPLTSVSATLAAPATRLAGFLHGYEAWASAFAPVSGPLGGLVDGAASTFAAVDSVRPALAATIDALPGAESAATTTLQGLHVPLDRLASLTVRLRTAGAMLPATLAGVNATLRAGAPSVTELPGFSAALSGALTSLRVLSRIPTTPGALRQLVSLLHAAQPLLAVLTPAQLDCNVLGLYGRNFSSAWGTVGTGTGPSYVIAGVVTPGAQNESLQAGTPAPNLHINYLPHEDAQECESGNEPFDSGAQDLANPPGNQSRSVPATHPPAGVTALARSAGLLTPPRGTPR